MLTFTNNSAGAVGLWDKFGEYHVAVAMGGQVTLEPSFYSRQTIEIYVASGQGSYKPVEVPTNTVEPSIDGTPIVGETLTAVNGTWTGEPTFSYVWLADDEAISDETGSTLELISDYLGQAISVKVTATNAAGSASKTSAPVGPVEAAPENVAPPSISGTAKVGETLTGDDGEWSGTPEPTLTRQWNRDDNPIEEATGSTYDLVEDDEGAEITLTVTATNTAGSASKTSAATDPVVAGD